MNNIVTLTPAAIARVNKLLQKQNSNGVFRIAVDKSGCSGWKYVVDIVAQATHDDEPIQISEILTIYVDRNSIELLQGSILDCEEKGLGMWQWIFKNPKAIHSCGCGESFSTGDQEQS